MHIHPFDSPIFSSSDLMPAKDSSSSSNSSTSSPASSSLSLVSRAKTALHSAAAKAERVLTEIKADLKNDRGDGDGQSLRGSRRPSEPELTAAADSSSDKPQEEVSERSSTADEVGANTSSKLTIPPASIMKQLAAAVENGKNFKSVNDILTSLGEPSPIKEKTGLSFSVVKSLVLRDKEDKLSSETCSDGELCSLVHVLFDSEEHFTRQKNGSVSASIPMTYLAKDIRGAPPESIVLRLSEIIGGFKSLQKIASFWGCFISELRRLWAEGQAIPCVPLDANPDLNSCLLHQHLQVINCCIARKQRRSVAIESLNSVLKQAGLDGKSSVDLTGKVSPNNMIYAKINTGEHVLRLGADHPSENLTMLETGEPIYSPVTQEGPILTDDFIKETEEFVLRTGSVGAGCSQLLSDMQAFKAANPGCVLEDFIRWHSPPDWTEMESDGQPSDSTDKEGSSRRGRLSRRMQKEGNLWRELWESAKPLPAINQAPLFDEDLAVERILTTLEDIPPSELFEQLFISVLCCGFLIAEDALPHDSNLSKLFYECKDYVIATCQSGISSENIGDICKVYETVETILVHPEEAIMIMEQPEETASEEPKSRFKKINLNFISKDRQLLRRKASKDEKKTDEKQTHVFSNLFDKKSSIFSRRNKSNAVPSPEQQPSCSLVESVCLVGF